MRHSIMLVLLLAAAGYAQPSTTETPVGQAQHEAAEDKTRTVPDGASLGIKACHKDIERWCKKVVPGEGRLGACLKARSKRLSKACRRWASHGGKAHMAEALSRDIDGSPAADPK